MNLRDIVILEKSNNKKGDLFGRLMGDLFHTLGYDEPRVNVHKSGREVDLYSSHRTEDRFAIAECKAHAETIGGADINKFIGVIDAERRKLKKDKGNDGNIVGYFVSLSGFKETAIEQENEFDNKRVILIKPEKIVEELIKGRVLVSKEKAVSAIKSNIKNLQIENYVDLLAYDKGWIWVLYYSDSHGQKTSHFALVHAEGKPLINEISNEIIALDKSLNFNLFDGLSLESTEESTVDLKHNLTDTEQKYFKYLENELGEIHFEGLPTDKEAGSVKVKLENIFVPLHLTKSEPKKERENKREGIGTILKNKSKLAILAKPGGGKSTMIKRIAIAYAFPDRRKEIKDNLPDRNWFPIFLRCRELGDKVRLSITEIIHSIPARAEINSCKEDFSILVSNSLQNGTALLLIDGLDEIAEDKNRIAFVNQLRTFIGTYPNINIIVTSREAGFRAVGGSLATYCENFTVSNLTGDEIKELSLKWHKAIIDDSANTSREAEKLSDLILKDNRIKVLAENPLLLTTLLFVKRWAGYLPTKRSVLYQEMIKLLLVTWNVEAHEILDIEEAEPQLAFVAYWMTKNGQQTITADELNICLIDARKQMPEILGYTNISPSEFIKRVESRSSLLIMSGHKRLESGTLTAVYEFLHLSFQEYLTAKAIVKRFISNIDSKKTTVQIIKPNVNNENWKEVIPLTAVLLERDTKDLIEYLISESQRIASVNTRLEKDRSKLASFLLGSCLANEVQISPDLLEKAIEWYAKSIHDIDKSSMEIILKNKFGVTFRAKLKELFFQKYDDKYIFNIGSILADLFFLDNSGQEKISIIEEIIRDLQSEDKERNCLAILGMMQYSFAFNRSVAIKKQRFDENFYKIIFERMLEFVKRNDKHYTFSIAWCIAWSEKAATFPQVFSAEFITYFLETWIKSSDKNLKTAISWALVHILVPTTIKPNIKNLKETVLARYENPENEFDRITSIFLDLISKEKWIKGDINDYLKSETLKRGRRTQENSNLSLFIKELGIEVNEPSTT